MKLIAFDDGTVFTLTWHESGVPTREIDYDKHAIEQALQFIGGFEEHIPRSGEQEPTNVWMANIDRDGYYCTLTREITLWRSNANRTATLVIEPDNLGAEPVKKINWPAKEQTTTFAFQEGAEYWIYFEDTSDNQYSLTFYQMPADIQSIPKRVVWMAKKGCIEQAKRGFPFRPFNENKCQ